MSDVNLTPAFSLPSGFRFGEVSSLTEFRDNVSAVPSPSLGPLTAFTGTFRGSGFNTIFRPDSTKTPTGLPKPITGSDNVLELNLTLETLSFSPSLGSVPNRGTGQQGDIFLNGVPYLQTITDVTLPHQPIGIHFEPGLWMAVPGTTDPAEGATVVRMASIPHGTTIEAQGTSSTAAGRPTIPAVNITPFPIGQPDIPANQIHFPSQTATNNDTPRIPQDLTSFIAAGTITQAMLDDPNTLLRNHIAAQNVISTTTISISTQTSAPLTGGGTDNIAFLTGTAAAGPNAQAVHMDATFWIETVQFSIQVPVFEQGQPVPEFLVNPPIPIKTPRTIKVNATQIQYSQHVVLNFAGLSWPHVSVATLVPNAPVQIPASAWT